MSVKDIRKIIADSLEEYAVDKDWYGNFDVELAQAIHDAGYRLVPDEVEVDYQELGTYVERCEDRYGCDAKLLTKEAEAHKAEWMRAKA